MSGPPPPRRPSRVGRRLDGPVPLADALGKVAERLGVGRADAVGVVFARWAEVVGPALADHARPVRMEAGTLAVAVDHQAWAAELRRLAPQLLERLRELCGDGAPSRLDVRVRPPR